MSSIAARVVVGEAEARGTWELQPTEMGLVKRPCCIQWRAGQQAWRSEIYIHGRRGIDLSWPTASYSRAAATEAGDAGIGAACCNDGGRRRGWGEIRGAGRWGWGGICGKLKKSNDLDGPASYVSLGGWLRRSVRGRDRPSGSAGAPAPNVSVPHMHITR